MPATVIVGLQWGDEGKGRICDLVAEDMDLVVRYQGGANAGHTVVVDGEEFRLHLVPSGILRPGMACLMADGMVIDPGVLADELAELASKGVATSELRLSGSAHVVMPYHRLLDRLDEQHLGTKAIGTTARGIGPAYADKAARVGVRVSDLVDPRRLRERLDIAIPRANALLAGLYGAEPLTADAVMAEVASWPDIVAPFITDGRAMVMDAVADDAEVLFEGAQGAFLDLDYGAYPFVTSSHPVAAGACLGTGIGPLDLDNVIGVAKAYTTRVGAGPFPAEAAEDEAQTLRELGREYGTTTGRPRRCGWFDACMVRTAVRLNSVSSLAVTKFDVLDSYEVIKMVTGYEIDGEMIDYVPSDPEVYVRCRPVVEEIAGWCKPTGEARKPSDLPGEARAYLEAIATQVEAPIAVVSVGPDRGSTVWYD